jgi:putative transposase
VLTEHGCPIAPTTYYAALARARTPSARERRDDVLKVEISRVYGENYRVYGARKVWLALNREGIRVGRCTVERLMSELGLVGARRGRRVRTTTADPAAARPADLLERNFNPPAPNCTWVADAHVRPDLVGHGLRRVRHRRLLPAHPGVASSDDDEDHAGGCPGFS